MRKIDTLRLISFPTVIIILAFFVAIVIVFLRSAMPAFERYGVSVLLENIWIAAEEPSNERYGLLGVLWGSVYTSLIAVIISFFLSISHAVFVVDYVPEKIKRIFVIITDIMAGLPTIIYGIWGSFVLVPFLKERIMIILYRYFSFIPIFDYPPLTGYSYFSAGILLAIMITPFSASMIREAYAMIPFTYKEAAYSIGLTRYETTKLIFGYIKPAVYSGMILAFARAAGETVAVSLVVGNTFNFTYKIFAPGYTISSLIANQFGDAFIYEYMKPVLFTAGFILFLIGLTASLLQTFMLRRWKENVKI